MSVPASVIVATVRLPPTVFEIVSLQMHRSCTATVDIQCSGALATVAPAPDTPVVVPEFESGLRRLVQHRAARCTVSPALMAATAMPADKLVDWAAAVIA